MYHQAGSQGTRLYVGSKRYGFGYLSLLSMLIDGIGRKVTPAVVLLAPVDCRYIISVYLT